MTTVGWGTGDTGDYLAQELRDVTAPVLDLAHCNLPYGILTPEHICLNTTGGHGTCGVRKSYLQFLKRYEPTTIRQKKSADVT